MSLFSWRNHPYVQLAGTIKGAAQQREREKDMKEYWPLCLAAADGNLKSARSAFYRYTFGKPAWRAHYVSEYMLRLHIADMTPEGFKRGSAVRGVDDQF
jgi:hypothetical protein